MALDYYQGIGRRKRATARVRLYAGNGKIVVNDLPLEEYFTRIGDQRQVLLPLETAGLRDTVNVLVKVDGGGVTGQSTAVSMGIARAVSHRGRADPFTPGERAWRIGGRQFHGPGPSPVGRG